MTQPQTMPQSMHTETTGQLPQIHEARNAGMALDLDWVARVQANTSAIERRAASLPGRRTVKKAYQAAWLARAITLIDLTTLAGDDTEGRVRRLCAKARQPVRADILDALGLPAITTGAVCVYHEMVPAAVDALDGFRHPGRRRLHRLSGGAVTLPPAREGDRGKRCWRGASEIDIVISRRHVLTGNWQALYDEMRDFRRCLRRGSREGDPRDGRAWDAQKRGPRLAHLHDGRADFIKTSTGKESVNATLPVTLTMVRAIRAYEAATGFKVGYKPAGGISKAKDALVYMAMMKEELGDRWLRPDLFRFGASSLLGDIERQLEHHATGAYSASYRHPAS
jgi:deoxyribose-phosphate aldolase